ncbi:hypothetical protein BSLG_006105 [Batrachochytrium salamandrivorans]|nr:hypothetical protein BSLG_006105 [Batrachochytrium salamandrivorans]
MVDRTFYDGYRQQVSASRYQQGISNNPHRPALRGQHMSFIDKWQGRTRPLLTQPLLNVNHLKPVKPIRDLPTGQTMLYPAWWGHEEHVVIDPLQDKSDGSRSINSGSMHSNSSSAARHHQYHPNDGDYPRLMAATVSVSRSKAGGAPAGVCSTFPAQEAWSPLADPQPYPKRQIDESTQTDLVTIIIPDKPGHSEHQRRARGAESALSISSRTETKHEHPFYSNNRQSKAVAPVMATSSQLYTQSRPHYNNSVPNPRSSYNDNQIPTRDANEEAATLLRSRPTSRKSFQDPSLRRSAPSITQNISPKKYQPPVSFVIPLSPTHISSSRKPSRTSTRRMQSPRSPSMSQGYSHHPPSAVDIMSDLYDIPIDESRGYSSFSYSHQRLSPTPHPLDENLMTRDASSTLSWTRQVDRSLSKSQRESSVSSSHDIVEPSDFSYGDVYPRNVSIQRARSVSPLVSPSTENHTGDSTNDSISGRGVMQLVDSFLASSFLGFLDMTNAEMIESRGDLSDIESDVDRFVLPDLSVNELLA